MKIKTFGNRGFTCQINRIDDGFRSLGHTIVDDPLEADMVYSNDRSFEDFSSLPDFEGIKILNVLDIPIRLHDQSSLMVWEAKLKEADVVTCISKKVASDILYLFGINAKVVYNPIRDLELNPPPFSRTDDFDFCYVGRANDPNKRFWLIKETFAKNSISPNKIAVFGSENPSFGCYFGVVSDIILSSVYSSIPAMIFPSAEEGLGLPPIEALCCGCYPIQCSDNQTALEFFDGDFIADPNPDSIFEKILFFSREFGTIRRKMAEIKKDFLVKFDKKTVAQNIINCL